jgi:hypothetical protein
MIIMMQRIFLPRSILRFGLCAGVALFGAILLSRGGIAVISFDRKRLHFFSQIADARELFGLVPSLNQAATLLRQAGQAEPCKSFRYFSVFTAISG